jgi:glucose-1-phosphatase
MSDKDIRLVIFDIGRVILDFDHMITCRKLAQYSKKDEKYIYDYIFKSEFLNEYEKGKIASLDMFEIISDKLGLDIPFEKFKKIWGNIFSLKEGIDDLIRRVKKAAKIAVLSNTDEMHFDFIMDSVEIMKEFDWLFLSHKIGFRKPDKEIFEYITSITGFAPNEIIFIDDIEEFVVAARKYGIKGILFKDINTLKKDLEAMFASR